MAQLGLGSGFKFCLHPLRAGCLWGFFFLKQLFYVLVPGSMARASLSTVSQGVGSGKWPTGRAIAGVQGHDGCPPSLTKGAPLSEGGGCSLPRCPLWSFSSHKRREVEVAGRLCSAREGITGRGHGGHHTLQSSIHSAPRRLQGLSQGTVAQELHHQHKQVHTPDPLLVPHPS